jgi:hypothetical protein
MCDIWTDINATEFVKGQFLSQGVLVTDTSDVINHFEQQIRLWEHKNFSACLKILEIFAIHKPTAMFAIS